jgi:hypothetical protein
MPATPVASALPVIPRIVHCTPMERDRRIARAVAYAIRSVRSAGQSTLGSMIAIGVLLAALGASSGVALRSLAGPPAQSPPSASPVPVATVGLSATAQQPGGSEKGTSDQADPVDESARPEAPMEQTSLATEPVARVAMTARTAVPSGRGTGGSRTHGALRSDHRAPRGRLHPTSARPLARRTTTGKSKVP